MAANLKTPETLPWIPPGQSQEESSNKFAHKKGSIAKQINEEVKKKRSRARQAERSKKSSITSSSTQSQILSLSDSGRGSELSSAEKNGLKDKIVEIFEEDENDYEYDSEGGIRRKYPDSTFDSGRGSLDEGRNKRKHADTVNFKDRQIHYQGSDDEVDEGNERKLSRRNDGLKSKISDYSNNTGRFPGNQQSEQIPLDVRALTPNTAEMRGYQAMRQELDHGDSIDSRHSIRYYNGDLTNRSQRTDELELSQSFMSYQISPRYKNSDQYRRQAVGEKPEAWLVFPDGRVPVNGSRLEDYPSPRAKMSINDYPSPRGRVSINDYPSPRIQMSRNDYPVPPRRLQLEPEKGLARAFPVNFASSIGSALKASFTNINGVRDTPVEEFNNDEERLVQGPSKQENRTRCPTWIWVFLICLGLVLLSGLLIAIVYGIVAATDASSSLVSRIQPGPGNNSPCNDYVALTERWRRITGLGPSQTGDPFNCDRDFQERWYRFDGDAGTVLADQSSPPSWEDCGTSRVGWLAGSHPDIRDGTVNRTLCVTAFGGNCEVKMTNGQVRGCPDPRGGIFYVYYLLRPGISCNWGYCALGPPS